MDGGAWLVAVYGVAQSWTRLKRLSSSSSSNIYITYLWGMKTLPQKIILKLGNRSQKGKLESEGVNLSM